MLLGWAGQPIVDVNASKSEFDTLVSSANQLSSGGDAVGNKAIKLSYSVQQCENELTNEFVEVLRCNVGSAGKASIKHLNPGRSYRYRIVAVNADGVFGPPSES